MKQRVMNLYRDHISSYCGLCQDHALDFNEANKWYDGYGFNKIGHVYSPNSIIEAVINQKCRIDTGTFQNDMTSLQGRDDVLTLLVHLGYLAYDDDSGEVYIPNEEVRQLQSVSPQCGADKN